MKKSFYKVMSYLISFLIVFFFLGHLNAQERKGCYLCGMFLDIYASTRHVIIYEDDTKKQTCSLACTAKLYQKRTKKIKQILVADFLSNELIDTTNVLYIEGSDIPGVMSYTSRIAFKKREQAREFQKKHGGIIMSFDEALQHQLKE